MISISLQLFARFAEVSGTRSVEVSLTSENTITALRNELKSRWPALSDLIDRSRFALNNEFVDDQQNLKNGDELAIIPPVSGGAHCI